jgi:hypothetical protein
MPYNIAYVVKTSVQLTVNADADVYSMISDFFYPQPGGVESHIYQLSSVCELSTVPKQLVYDMHVQS